MKNLYGTYLPISMVLSVGLQNFIQWLIGVYKLLGNPSAEELMEIVAVGLAQNFAALRSLITSGIQQGHMKMHLPTY